MTTLFISDLHLTPSDPARIKLATDFLKTHASQCSSLYILGDLFNTWLGDDIVPTEFTPFTDELKSLHQHGIKTYLMVGNRDFMMGKAFAKQVGCELLKDEYVIDLYGVKTLLLHGDTLCIDDVSYQKYRKWTRIPALQWCFRHLPKSYRQSISDKIKQKSRQQKRSKSAMIMDVNQSEVERVMSEYNVSHLIHGHTHRPDFHHLNINNRPSYRIVLGDWEDEISYLQCDDTQLHLNDPRISKSISIKYTQAT